jgi:hypothetical protein
LKPALTSSFPALLTSSGSAAEALVDAAALAATTAMVASPISRMRSTLLLLC